MKYYTTWKQDATHLKPLHMKTKHTRPILHQGYKPGKQWFATPIPSLRDSIYEENGHLASQIKTFTFFGMARHQHVET